MTPLDWFAAFILFLHLPIPLFWFVVHPFVGFWRRHSKASYIVGLLLSWPPVTASMVVFRHELFRPGRAALWSVLPGFALIIFEGWLFARLTRDLGAARLLGKTELAGGGSIARNGIYAHVRHPRYVGSLLAIVGACLIAGTRAMWLAAAIWTAMMLLAISLEEREMRARFGAEYEIYTREVPRFLPALSRPRR